MYNIIIGHHQQVKILTTKAFHRMSLGQKSVTSKISVSGTFIKHLTSDTELNLKIPVLHYKGPFCSGNLLHAQTLEFTGGYRFLEFSLRDVRKIRFHQHYNCPNIHWLREICNIDVIVNRNFITKQNLDLKYCWPNCNIIPANTVVPPGF